MFGKFTSKFIANIAIFIVSFCFLFFLCRLLFILDIGYFGGLFEKNGGISLSDLSLALFDGLRYDARIVASASLFYMVLYLVFSYMKGKLQSIILTLFSMILAFIVIAASVGNDAFYKIFGDTYNIMLLGLVYDDRDAIFQTAVSGEYNAAFRIGLMVIGAAVFGHFYYRLVKIAGKIKPWSKLQSVIFSVAAVYLIGVMMSSTMSLQGGSIDYLITPPKDVFLKKTAPGALRDLHLVYITYSNLKGDNFEKYAGGATAFEAAEIYFGNLDKDKDIDLNALMKRTVETGGGSSGKIDHIFVIVAESFSSWHFDDEFDSIGLAGDLKKLSQSEKGKRMEVFLENAEGTIGAIDVMVTGLYNTGLPISERTGSLDIFNSSCAPFRDLGYENRFYYFGSPAWRKLDRYVLSQGFDKIYSVGDMEGAKRGVWGVSDDAGFDFVLKKTGSSENVPTFNMILTTMYHPPYDMPLRELGVPMDDIEKLLDKNYPLEERNAETTATILGHAYLANKILADFISAASEKFPNSIIFLTGDHFDRMYPSKIRNQREKYSVPFIVYGKNIDKAKFIEGAGSQIDIIPTVMELVAPRDFEYHAFGRPLLSFDKNASADKERFALGYQSVANSRFIADSNKIQYINNGAEELGDKTLAEKELLRDRMGKALSWWIINKGYIIPAEKKGDDSK